MLDENKIREQLAAFQRQQDWVTGAIAALQAILNPAPPPPAPEPPAE